MARIDLGEQGRWRNLDAAFALQAFTDPAKRDRTFEPIKDRHTTRWHAQVLGREFELLLTGPKFFDTRAKTGGGRTIDSAMHLLRIDFKTATGALWKKVL
ncbi:hypothetical protein [Rhodocyclus tenuis]|uniref:Uncharacterized protein n=1 Tax=Rhodocyclus tenuis TaxID=1066 RepID=A0A840GAP4_RHOTE|nr:hypothetical protein [Rhodocyclus tenuis]MBB4247970.1 hypothetical protein [Rhodocyclus tenuis]